MLRKKKQETRGVFLSSEDLEFIIELKGEDPVSIVNKYPKKKLLRYIDIVMTKDMKIPVVHPTTKKGIELWNERARETGREDLIIDLEKTLQEAKEKEAADKTAQRVRKSEERELKKREKAAKKVNMNASKENEDIEPDYYKQENSKENIIEGDTFILYMNVRYFEKYPEAYGYIDDIEITNESQVAENQIMTSDSHIEDSTELEEVDDCNIQSEEGEIVKNSGIRIEYNPFKVETKIFLGNSDIANGPTQFRGIRERRLQEWTEILNESWQGIFNELKKVTGRKNLTIYFTGTVMDFDDLEKARKKFIDDNDDCSVTLIHANKETADSIDPSNKINELRDAFEKLKLGPIEELKQEYIVNRFNKALNNEFKITIVAPMSSGKSTLVNAFIGKDLLPASNLATTAVITEIKDDDTKKDFILTNVEPEDDTVLKNTEVDNKKIKELNDAIEPNDRHKKKARYEKIRIEGPIPSISSQNINVVFVDTPGGNNSQNDEHRKLMDKAIGDSDELVLFVCDGRKLTEDDSKKILNKIATAMKTHVGSQFRERFLFVINYMDDYDIEKESYESVLNSVKKTLSEIDSEGFENARLFLVSAEACKLARIKKLGGELSDHQKRNLKAYADTFSEVERILTRYASLNDSEKEKLISEAEEKIGKAKTIKKSLKLIDERNKELDEKGPEADEAEYRKLRLEKNSLKNELEELQLWCVEHNSGIPAVECAINEYIEKYAICIKIKALHDAFMKEVNGKDNQYNYDKILWESKEERKNLENAIKADIKSEERAEKLLEIKQKIENIKIDEELFTGLQQDIQQLVIEHSMDEEFSIQEAKCEYYKFFDAMCEKLTYAESYINMFYDQVERNIREMTDEVESYLNKELQEVHFGAISLDNFMQDLDLKPFMYDKDVVIGTIKEKKKGFIAALARIFGGGFEEKEKYGTETYVKWDKVSQEIRLRNSQLKDQLDMIKEEGIQKIDIIKNQFFEELNGIEQKISEIRMRYLEKVSNFNELTDEIQKNERKRIWLANLKNEVDNLMDIDQGGASNV